MVWITSDCNNNMGGLDCETLVRNLWIQIAFIGQVHWRVATLIFWKFNALNCAALLLCTMHKVPLSNSWANSMILHHCVQSNRMKARSLWLTSRAIKPTYVHTSVCVLCVWVCDRYPFVWLSIVVRTFFLFTSSYPSPSASVISISPHIPGTSVSIWVLARFHSSLNPTSDSTYLPKIRLSLRIALSTVRQFHWPHRATRISLAISCSHTLTYRAQLNICKADKSHIFRNMQFPLWWKRCNAYSMLSYQSVRSFCRRISFIFMAILVAMSDTPKR